MRPNTILASRTLKPYFLDDDEGADTKNQSLRKIVKLNNHFGEDIKYTEAYADPSKYGSLRRQLNQLMTKQQQGIVNLSWSFDQVISSSRCLCFKSSYVMHVVAQLNK